MGTDPTLVFFPLLDQLNKGNIETRFGVVSTDYGTRKYD